MREAGIEVSGLDSDIVLVAVVTALLAPASCYLVERPALQLARHTPPCARAPSALASQEA